MNLNPLRKLKALYSLASLVKDPNRLGEVFEMSDALATPEAMQPIVDRLAKDPGIARAFRAKHRIAIDIPSLRRLPEGTLGRTFADHMIANGLDPSALPTLPGASDIEWFRAHLYETHDIWHVVTGYATDLVGELGLQAFYLAQIPGPLPSLLVAIGFLRSAIYDQELTLPFMDALVEGWKLGRTAQPLFGVRWDDLWTVPIEDVRLRLGLGALVVARPTVAPPASSASSLAA